MQKLEKIREEMSKILCERIIPFWLNNGIDEEFGGYLTCFDEKGNFTGDSDKYIVTQTRMIWGFSYLSRYCREEDKERLVRGAVQGFEFFIRCFWDDKNGGFCWKTDRKGNVLDFGKVIYGQSFAIYALSEYYLCTGDKRGLEYAEKTFDLIQLYATDTENGGYFENLEPDWQISAGGKFAGDRKSLDIHMHLMEAFTTLYRASGREVHSRKLREVINLIIRHMVNSDYGYGYNQFDLEFHRIPAINVHRTWNAERGAGEEIKEPTDSTSYGHNVELSWLMNQSLDFVSVQEVKYTGLIKKLLDHSLKYGYDYEYGGVYRDGIADGEVLVTDKEWWQNFEALVGYSNGYLKFGEDCYLKALFQTWDFVRDYFMDMDAGESRQLLDRFGSSIIADIGNPWKGIYHTGRALAETIDRLDCILSREE